MGNTFALFHLLSKELGSRCGQFSVQQKLEAGRISKSGSPQGEKNYQHC